jgi:hypothetical protein
MVEFHHRAVLRSGGWTSIFNGEAQYLHQLYQFIPRGDQTSAK